MVLAPAVELRDLPASALAPRYRAHLLRAGFLTPLEVLLVPHAQLAARTRLPPLDCAQLLDQLAVAVTSAPLGDPARALTAAVDDDDGTVTTGDPQLDRLFGGRGIHVGALTEVAGPASSGKTHLCLQLALTVQLPPALGGLGGGALFISSEGTVPSPRLFQLAGHYAQHQPDRTPWDFLDNVHAEKAPDLDTLAAVLAFHAPATVDRVAAHAASATVLPLGLAPDTGKGLAAFSSSAPRPSQRVLASRPSPARPPLPIRLVIVDSLAAPFRAETASTSSSSFAHRAKDLASLSDSLKTLAARYSCAVVVTNQVSDAFSPDGPSGSDAYMKNSLLTAVRDMSIPAPHDQLGLPPQLYSRVQTPHFSGLTASLSNALLSLPFGNACDDISRDPQSRIGGNGGGGGGSGVQAALGHAWSNAPNVRVLLLVRRRGGVQLETRRAAALVWSPFAPRAVVETHLGEGGLEAVGEVRRRAVVYAAAAASEEEADSDTSAGDGVTFDTGSGGNGNITVAGKKWVATETFETAVAEMPEASEARRCDAAVEGDLPRGSSSAHTSTEEAGLGDPGRGPEGPFGSEVVQPPGAQAAAVSA